MLKYLRTRLYPSFVALMVVTYGALLAAGLALVTQNMVCISLAQ
jgi:hypothetical protein